MATNKMSRREFLKFSGLAVAGAVLASCAPKSIASDSTAVPVAAPTSAAGAVSNVVFMHKRSEFLEADELAFEAENPDIKVELVEFDLQKFFAMLAAGTPLDLYRTQGASIPQLLARKIPADLTAYFQASQLVKIDDLMEVNKLYFAKSPTEIGEGSIYGMCKDWSPDFSLWVNDGLFEAAGVEPMDDTKVYTWDEVRTIAASVAKQDGDRTASFGYGFEGNWLDFILMNALAEKNLSLYDDNFRTVNFGEDAKAIAQTYLEMEKNKIASSTLSESPNGWHGGDFTGGVLAIDQWGYWFGGMAESDANRGKVRMLPAPTYFGDHRDPAMGATGTIMLKNSQVKDAAWKLFEYYNGGTPSATRASSGWGVPALKSQMGMMPNKTPFQQQVQKVLTGELAVAGKNLKHNPYLAEGAFMTSYATHRDEVLTGAITFDEMINQVTQEVNALIKEGIDRIAP